EAVEDEMHVFFDCDRPKRVAGCRVVADDLAVCNDTRQQQMWFFISAVLQNRKMQV
ncbi:hypothetical protein L195_g059057, partial [Trifolium pratense]